MSGKCYLQAALHRNLWRSSPWVMGLGWRARGPFRAASFTYLLAFISRPDARHILRCDLPACAPPPLHGCGADAPRAPAVSLALGESPAGLGASVTAFRARWEGSTLKCGDCGQFLHPSKQRQLTGPLRGWETGAQQRPGGAGSSLLWHLGAGGGRDADIVRVYTPGYGSGLTLATCRAVWHDREVP